MVLPLVRLLSGFKQKPAYVVYLATLFLVCAIGLALPGYSLAEKSGTDIKAAQSGPEPSSHTGVILSSSISGLGSLNSIRAPQESLSVNSVVNFDDVTSTEPDLDDVDDGAAAPIAGNRYQSKGVLLSGAGNQFDGLFAVTETTTDPLDEHILLNTSPNALCARTDHDECGGQVIASFVQPGTVTPATTSRVSFYVADNDAPEFDGVRLVWSASVFGLTGNLIETITGTGTNVQVVFDKPGIQKLIFTPSSEFEAIDTLEFLTSAQPEPPEDIAGSYGGSTTGTLSNCVDPIDNGGFLTSVNVRLYPPTTNGNVRTVTGLVTISANEPNGRDAILDLSATLSDPGNLRTLTNGVLNVHPPSAFSGSATFSGQWTRGNPDALTFNYTGQGSAFGSNCAITGAVNDTRLGPPPPITFTQGILTQPQSALDPAVQATQQNGTFTIKPRAGVSNLHYNGFVSDQFINLNDFSIAVEAKQTATGGAETVFSIGDDPDNFYRFVKIDGTRPPAAFDEGDSIRVENENTTVPPAFLFFQIKIDGIPASFNIPFDPVLHRFWRFRHEKLDDTINFETSPDQATWTNQRKVGNKKGVSEMTAELSAGTSASVTDPGTAIFGTFMLGDNFSIAGQVKNSSNAGLPGVKVDLSGWTSLTAMTDSNGRYSFAPLDAGKNYVVKLSLAGYSFPEQTFNALGSDKIVEVAAAECSFTLAATNTSAPSSATTGSVGLTASASDCASSAVSNVPWISVTSGGSGTGNRSVNYSVAANTSSVARSGTLTIGGKTFTVNQAGVACSFALSAPTSSMSASAGTGSVGFTATASDCAWTASSNAPWITITSAAAGTGNSTVNYAIALNTVAVARSGTFTIGGQTFTVNQAAPTFEVVALIASQAEIKTWTIGGRTYAYLKLLFPNAGYRVSNWGQATKAGNDFTADAAVEKFTGGSVQAVTTTAQIYDLGPLANGTYNFNFKTSGTLAKTLQFTLSSTVPPLNPIDLAREFVKQQYRDFLNREADPAGEDFWTDNINKCNDPARRPAGQTVEQCTQRQKETTSGAFFQSPEFQYTGYFVYRMYQGGLGRQPKLSEFIPDAQFVGNGIVVNGQLSGAVINQNKAAFAALFVNCTDATKYRCSEFKAIYDGLSNTQYVDKLFQTTGVNASATDRTALVNGLNANPATETRASVLQKVVDGITVAGEGNQQFTTTYGQAFYNSELNRAFVELEYFGYMKRDPDDAGYAFWLNKLNAAGGNFVNAEMVLAFISSPEYRARFGQP